MKSIYIKTIILIATFIFIDLSIANAFTIDKVITKTGNSLTNGLIGYWTFDGKDLINNVADLSGQGHTGYMSNFTSTSSAVAPGEIGQALGFDGVNDLVDTGASDWINTSALTVSAWIRPKSHGEGGAGSILDNRKAIFGMYDGAGTNAVTFSSNAGVTTAKSANGSVPFNKWTHVIATRDASGVVNFYVNGTLSGTANQNSGTPAAGTVGVQIGNTVFLSRTWDGYIDDLRVYNRVLSATEAKQLYNQNSSYVSKTNTQINGASVGLGAGLVGHWTFDGKNMVSNVADSSGLGNNGLMSGFTSTSSAVTAGKVGQGLSFDGVNDYVNCGSNSSVLPDIFSFSAWVKINNNNPAGANMIMGWSSSTAYPGLLLKFSNSRPLLYLGSNNYRYFSASSPTNVADTNWHHYVFIVTGNTLNDIDNSKLYVDGKEQDVFLTLKTGNPSTKLLCRLGMGGDSPRMNGIMDDARIYSRALSTTEIQQLYSQGSTKVASTISRPAQTGLTSGLVGHWTFDGKDTSWATYRITDKSPSGNTATISGMSTSTSPKVGKVGQALTFDMVNDKLVISPSSSLNNMSSFTYSLWIRPHSNGQSELGYIFTKGSGGSGGYLIQMDVNRFDITINYDGGTNLAFVAPFDASTYNRWSHLVMTWDGTNVAANVGVYLNGVALSHSFNTNGVGSKVDDSSYSLTIGDNGSNTRYFDGEMDDFRVYNRVLSASEIQQLYNNGK